MKTMPPEIIQDTPHIITDKTTMKLEEQLIINSLEATKLILEFNIPREFWEFSPDGGVNWMFPGHASPYMYITLNSHVRLCVNITLYNPQKVPGFFVGACYRLLTSFDEVNEINPDYLEVWHETDKKFVYINSINRPLTSCDYKDQYTFRVTTLDIDISKHIPLEFEDIIPGCAIWNKRTNVKSMIRNWGKDNLYTGAKDGGHTYQQLFENKDLEIYFPTTQKWGSCSKPVKK